MRPHHHDTAIDLEKHLNERLLKLLPRSDPSLAGCSLPDERYHRKSSPLKLSQIRPKDAPPNSWATTHRKIVGVEGWGEAKERFEAAVLIVVEEVKKTLRIRTEGAVAKAAVTLALTSNLKGELMGIQCLIRVTLAEPHHV